ncbi:hypothetical protein JTB14_036753 [Gonioctena quinquepunctata]|nr:hypothetical protein JTB14_036753 [Gonioctena quinquepunctata]
MVRNYERKCNRGVGQKYSLENLNGAIDAVKNGQMTCSRAAELFPVPRSTIQLRVRGWTNRQPRGKSPSGKPRVFPIDVEIKLAENIKTMNRWGFGLTRKELLDTVQQYVQSNQLKTSFKDGRPGEDWYLSFSKRHRLSLKKAELLEASRAKQHQDPFIIYDFFDKLESIQIENHVMTKPNCIWNADETGFSHDPKRITIVAGVAEVAQRQSAGSGRDMTTVLACVNAAGAKMPPLVLHKGKRLWDNMLGDQAYPGTLYYVSDNGWMTEQVFFKWFEQVFLVHCKDRPAILIYDGHLSHVSQASIELAMSENIIILKLPPHTSTLLQPLDVSVFKGVKSTWNLRLADWQRRHIGEKISKSVFANILGEVWYSIKDTAIINGFRKTGVYPCDRSVIPKTIFDKEKLARYEKQYIVNQEKSDNDVQNEENTTFPN